MIVFRFMSINLVFLTYNKSFGYENWNQGKILKFWYVCFSFGGNRPICSSNIANWIFALGNSRSSSWLKSTKIHSRNLQVKVLNATKSALYIWRVIRKLPCEQSSLRQPTELAAPVAANESLVSRCSLLVKIIYFVESSTISDETLFFEVAT